jgi:hypothetical protein
MNTFFQKAAFSYVDLLHRIVFFTICSRTLLSHTGQSIGLTPLVISVGSLRGNLLGNTE